MDLRHDKMLPKREVWRHFASYSISPISLIFTTRSSNGKTCLHSVADNCHWEGSLEKIELLLPFDALINTPPADDGETPVSLSALVLSRKFLRRRSGADRKMVSRYVTPNMSTTRNRR